MFVRASLLLYLILCGVTPLSAVNAADKLPPAPAKSISFVIIPDTQAYKGVEKEGENKGDTPLTNPIFDAHVDWIVENLDKQSIAFVSHVGDIVDKNEPEQWKVAQRCMDKIHGKVPYGISVGNHDMTSKGDSTLFQQYFPQSRFADFPWYAGSFPGLTDNPQISGNNANSYQLFSAGGRDFLFLHLECNAPDNVIEWANGILSAHPNRLAFITSHMGWGPLKKPKNNDEFIEAPKGRMEWSKIHGARGNSPQQLWEKCYRKHPHLVAVFSGDQSRTQTMHAQTTGDHGNQIHEILQDYSTGWLRLVRFLPEENRFEVYTFNPKDEALCKKSKHAPDPDQHQFRFDLPRPNKD
ncbi:metallophosphoesterase [Planctomicrobium sp. SH527]|uniref:metallophosphoesterase n=1 Tax=Planctomicrobium sp. SH527 TaxID=3448123 RepID=UPI003F5C1BC3